MELTEEKKLSLLESFTNGDITADELQEYLSETKSKTTKKTVTALTATEIKSAKPKAKDYQMADGRGLSLLVRTNGSKLWRMRFRFEGKYKSASLGIYPDVSLAEARKRRETFREKLANGINPIEEKRGKKEVIIAQTNRKTFKEVLDKYLKSIENTVSQHHYKRSESLLRLYATPLLGNVPIEDITHKEVKKIIVSLSDQGKKASAKKLHGALLQVFNEAVRQDYTEINIIKLLDLKTLVTNYAPKPQSTITDTKEVAKLITNIKNYDGHISTKKAMHFMILTALRSYNVRALKWKYIQGNILVIPKEEMKITWDKVNESKDFKLPLATQTIELLEEMQQYSHGQYVFPSLRGDRPLSDNALLSMVRNMGYTKEEFTPHGSRAMFATLANEKGDFNVEIIDAQLAHKVGGAVSQRYNRSDYLQKRAVLSQWWADYLDSIQSPLQFEDAEDDDEIYQDRGINIMTVGLK